MTPVNARPIEIQMADSIAASLMVMTCAVRCTSSRSTTSSDDDEADQREPVPRLDVEVRELLAGVGLLGCDATRTW